MRLLPRLLKRKFAVTDSIAQTVGKPGCSIFTICGDELGERCEQAGLRQTIAVDAVKASFRPGFPEVAKCHALLLAIRNHFARVN